jgi:hypothetical protein
VLAAGRHSKAGSDADAAVKVYDLVAGAAVDAAWREDPLVKMSSCETEAALSSSARKKKTKRSRT